MLIRIQPNLAGSRSPPLTPAIERHEEDAQGMANVEDENTPTQTGGGAAVATSERPSRGDRTDRSPNRTGQSPRKQSNAMNEEPNGDKLRGFADADLVWRRRALFNFAQASSLPIPHPGTRETEGGGCNSRPSIKQFFQLTGSSRPRNTSQPYAQTDAPRAESASYR